ncbi:MAG: NUDIX hydrolase, partial [Planctomycetota bacterium]
MPSSPRHWERLSSETAENLHLFQPRWDLMVNPRTGQQLRRLVLETRDWVNVVARTLEGSYLLVRQYRFGTERVTTEVPGGLIDPGEEPLDAARRELREETGYEAERWSSLGSVAPNPAVQDNRCYHFLAQGARCVGELEQDAGEDLVVCTLSEAELRAAVASGEIDHALVLS